MKKFYTLIVAAFVSASLLLSFSSNLQAQQCPAGPQKVFKTTGYSATGQPISTVYVEGFPPAGNITLWAGGFPIFNQNPPADPAVTDASGKGKIIYTSPLTPTRVIVTSAGATCEQPVPAASASCGNATLFNAHFPAFPLLGIPEFCGVFIINALPNAEVRAFDVFQNLVPTFNSTPPLNTTDVGFTVYTYDCANLISSITICTATECCSYLVPAAASLPIKLKYFNAKLSNNKDVLLSWASDVEINSDKFVVEKSNDGRNFTALADIKTGGNSTATRSYSYTDGAFSSIAYYRLKMVDIDGRIEYSKVVYVNLRGGSGAVTQIFPNPFKSDIQIIGISSSDLNSKNIRVFNATGAQVNFKITGANAISLDEHAPRGMYILAIKEQRFKLIKE